MELYFKGSPIRFRIGNIFSIIVYNGNKDSLSFGSNLMICLYTLVAMLISLCPAINRTRDNIYIISDRTVPNHGERIKISLDNFTIWRNT